MMAIVLILVLTAVAFAASADKAERPSRPRLDTKPKITASPSKAKDASVLTTIIYDPGAPADAFRNTASAGSALAIVGNQFSSRSGSALLQSGTITGFTFFPNNAGSTVVVSILGPAAGGSGTQHIASFQVYGVADATFNYASLLTPLGVGSSFNVGMYLGYIAGYPSIGMRSASINSQGFHGIQANFLYISSGNYAASGHTPLSGVNAMMRVSGDLLVPVELMNFTIE